MEYKVGQVLDFKYYDGLFMKAISWGNAIHYGDKGYTHSAIIGEVEDKQILLYEAGDKGIIKGFYDRAAVDDMHAQGKMAIGTPNQELEGIKEACEKYLGEPYDWGSIFDIARYWITGIQDVKYADPKAFICSEFVAQVLIDCGFDLSKLNLPTCLMAPMDLYEAKNITWLK